VDGFGRFLDKNTIEVEGPDGKKSTVEGKNVIIATGSDVMNLPGVEIDEKQIVSSTGALELDSIPEHLVLIGGGGWMVGFFFSLLIFFGRCDWIGDGKCVE